MWPLRGMGDTAGALIHYTVQQPPNQVSDNSGVTVNLLRKGNVSEGEELNITVRLQCVKFAWKKLLKQDVPKKMQNLPIVNNSEIIF